MLIFILVATPNSEYTAAIIQSQYERILNPETLLIDQFNILVNSY